MKLTELERSELERYTSLYDFKDFLRNKTFMITGSKGIVGSAAIKWLLFENEIHGTNTKIIASTRFPNSIPNYVEDGDPILFCKFGEENAFTSDIHLDYVISAATSTNNSFHIKYPVESFRVIVEGTQRMLDISSENTDCCMLFLSSEEVYGLPDTEELISESYVGAIDSLNIRNCYPLGKKAAELLCLSYACQHGLNVKIIRPTVIQGLFQKYDEPRVVNEILRCVLENKNFVMKTDGTTKKCLIYSLDVISAAFTVLFKGESGEAYNVSNPDTYMSVKNLAQHVFKTFNPACSVIFSPADIISEGYLPHRTLAQNIGKLCSLGWKPETSLDDIYRVDIMRFLSNGASEISE